MTDIREVLDAAVGDPPPPTDPDDLWGRVLRRRRRRSAKLAVTTVAVVCIVVGAAVVATRKPHNNRVATSPTTVSRIGASPSAAWIDDKHQLVVGRLHNNPSANTTVVAQTSTASSTTPLVRVDNQVFFVTSHTGYGDIKAFNLDTGSLTVIGRARSPVLFAGPDGHSLYVRTDGHHLERWSLDGQRIGGPWTLPKGWGIEPPQSPGALASRSVANGVLIESVDSDGQFSGWHFAVWNPDTGAINPLGSEGVVIGAWTDAAQQRSLVAWLHHTCEGDGCGLAITDTKTGTTREIKTPNDLGFIGGGAFAPDGSTFVGFAIVANTPSDRSAQALLIDTKTGSSRPLATGIVDFGENYAWATWNSSGTELLFGSLRLSWSKHDNLYRYERGDTDATAEPLPLNYSTVALP